MSEKKKVKFTAVDAVVLVVVLAVLGFVGFKFFGPGAANGGAAEAKTYIVSYYFEEVPGFAAVLVKPGDAVSDEQKKHALGTVTNVKVGDAAIYCSDDEGNLHKSAKENYNSVTLTTEVEAVKGNHGIQVSGTTYTVGHSMTVYAGDAKMFGKVAGIAEK
ncbi:MAG: DUF4330 family protein [Ruminococcaceae bacterium]|nr:DUF4330 family protein [Oscillospiraceae bacterium]